MKLSELKEEIRAMVGPIVADAMEPYKKQQTDWFAHLIEQHKRDVKDNGGLEKGIRAARFVRALAAGKGDPERGLKHATKWWGADDEVSKALAAGDAQAGGVLVPPTFSTELIELLRNRAAVRSLGPRIVPMPNGTLSIPKHTGGTTVGYIGENENIGVTEPTVGEITLTWKKLAALVPISNDLLMFNSIDADSLVRDDLADSMALREDLAFMRGDGLQQTPKGIRNWMLAASQLTSATYGDPVAPDLDELTSELSRMQLALEHANVRFINPGWLMAPRTRSYIANIRDGNGNFAYRDEMRGGTLEGYPFRATNQVPRTLGGGDESELYLVDFADVIIGESSDLMIDASSEAAYHDGAAVQASFSRDQTVIRVIARHDLGMRHEESAVMITDVRWGA